MSTPADGSNSAGWDHLPNGDVAAAITFMYAVVSMIVLAITVKTKTYFMLLVFVAGLFETAGFAARVVFANSPRSSWLTAAEFFIVIAPSLLMATESYCVTMLARRTWIGAGSFLAGVGSFFFALSTAFTAALKGAGVVLVSSGLGSTALHRIGQEVLISGVTLQLIFFSLLTGMTIHSHLDPDFGLVSNEALRPLLFALYTKIVLLFARNIFRLVEFIQGPNGFIAQHEAMLYAFDVVPVFACFILYCMFHYGFYLSPKKAAPQDFAVNMTKQEQPRSTIHISASTFTSPRGSADQQLYSPHKRGSDGYVAQQHVVHSPQYAVPPPNTKRQSSPSAAHSLSSQPQYADSRHRQQGTYLGPPVQHTDRVTSPPRYTDTHPAPARFSDYVTSPTSHGYASDHSERFRSPKSRGFVDYRASPAARADYPDAAVPISTARPERFVAPAPPGYSDYVATRPTDMRGDYSSDEGHARSPPRGFIISDNPPPAHYSEYVHSIHSYAEHSHHLPQIPHHRTQSPRGRTQSPSSQRAPSPNHQEANQYGPPSSYRASSPNHQQADQYGPPSSYRASSPNHQQSDQYGPPPSYRASSPNHQQADQYGPPSSYRVPSPNSRQANGLPASYRASSPNHRQPDYPPQHPLTKHPSPRQAQHSSHQPPHLPPQFVQPSPRQAHYHAAPSPRPYEYAEPPSIALSTPHYALPPQQPIDVMLPTSYSYQDSSEMEGLPGRNKRSSDTEYSYYAEPPAHALFPAPPLKPARKSRVQA